jgi:hypothetical protein
MPQMQVVRAMTKQPGYCFQCGQSPVDSHGNTESAVDLNRDYDWGHNAYLCMSCAHLLATLIDRPTPEEVEKIKKDNARLRKNNKELTAKLTSQEEDLETIRQGTAAVKRVKANA